MQLNTSAIWSMHRGAWFFLQPVSHATAVLQRVPAGAVELPPEIGQRLGARKSCWLRFDASPALTTPMQRQGVWAVGDAAVSFDPMGGDGTGHALRGAVLLAACLVAVTGGEPLEKVAEHYEGRIRSAYADHLARCSELYRTGSLAAMAVRNTKPEDLRSDSDRYRLVRTRLVARA
ncbi:FAD-dependent monooxygenase [Candidatus Accumulibacter sp. ACC003]|uniref:FAD-dependent monooxygenase n=1 Tax=Candidatus Accumulibacter sp. ACC003 TaxID=2823334 RepID=UPI00344E9CB7